MVYALVSGSSAHAGLEEDNIGIIAGKSPLKPQDIIDCSVNEYDERMKAGDEGADFDAAEGRDRLCTEIAGPITDYAEKLRPIFIDQGIEAAEKEIIMDVGGVPFIGYTDLTTKRLVVDYKFLSRRKSKAQVDLDPQLVVYEKAVGKTGAFVQLLRKKVAETVIPERSEETTKCIYNWCVDTVKCIEMSKKSGLFPAADPTNWVCNNCSFRRKCLGQ